MKIKIVSCMLLFLLLIVMLGTVFNIRPVKAEGTIYIRADGSIDPPTAPIQRDGDVYTFTNVIYFSSVVVEKDDIVVDGAYHVLQGTSSGAGITLSGRNNVTIRNIWEIKSFDVGVSVSSSSNISIVGNKIAYNINGISLSGSSDNSVVGNNITSNTGDGILVSVVETRVTNNSIVRNNITDNGGHGISLSVSGWFGRGGDYQYNSIVENNIADNEGQGISFSAGFGGEASYNSVVGNNIANNSQGGISLSSSSSAFLSYNSLVGNKITNNTYGIYIGEGTCNYNFVYYNDFVNNTYNVYTSGLVNAWDNGYPSGGNYWSDYNGTDSNGDGIGDTPYVIDLNNQDNYPLMSPYLYADVNHDGVVNMRDIGLCCSAFGSHSGDPNWNPHCDINEDGTVNMRDIGIACTNFGKHYP